MYEQGWTKNTNIILRTPSAPQLPVRHSVWSYRDTRSCTQGEEVQQHVATIKIQHSPSECNLSLSLSLSLSFSFFVYVLFSAIHIAYTYNAIQFNSRCWPDVCLFFKAAYCSHTNQYHAVGWMAMSARARARARKGKKIMTKTYMYLPFSHAKF